MHEKRVWLDDEAARDAVLKYVQERPGQSCQEADIKNATGVAKARVRGLMLGVAGIDAAKLQAGAVCWNPPDVMSTEVSSDENMR